MPYLIGFLMFFTVLIALFGYAIGKEEKQRRLIEAIEGIDVVKKPKPAWMQKVEDVIGKLLPSQIGVNNLEKNLRHAGRPFKWNAHDVTVVQIVVTVLLVGLSLVVDATFEGHIFISIIFAGMGYMMPHMLIYSYKSMRQARTRRQMRGFTLTLALLSSTGIRFEQAVDEAIQTVTGEFRNILDQFETRLDFRSTVIEAFSWLADEIGIKEMDRLYMVIKTALENGTQVSFALQSMISEHDQELENKIERISQNVNLKVTLIVLFLIVGPSLAFYAIITGINMIDSFKSF